MRASEGEGDGWDWGWGLEAEEEEEDDDNEEDTMVTLMKGSIPMKDVTAGMYSGTKAFSDESSSISQGLYCWT